METDTASDEQSDEEKAEAEKELSETLAPVPNYEVLDEDLKEVGIYKVSLETDPNDE